MAKNINALVSTALDAVHAYGKTIDAIRVALKGSLSPEEVREALLEPIARYYAGAKWDELLVDKVRGEGKTWDKEHAKWETAKKAHQRMVADIVGEVNKSKEELEVPAHIAKLAAQLVKACGEYESAAKLRATAIAQAKAAK